jgi:peptide/nickel transport system ATP-binding protein
VSNTVLEVSNLSVAINGGDRTHAVQGINLTVGADEIVCVVGESGSGKSVTAQAVMGLLPKGAMQVESGSIRLQGDQLLTKSDAELRAIRGTRMAMVFQEPMTALNPVERVGDQIREVLEIHTSLDQKEQRARVLEIMRAVHLPDPEQMIDAYPHQLSGGQRQRIMIAAALVLDPALLIADEPTTALDVTTQAQILKLVREMQGRKKTGVLFITHDFGVVSEIADRVVVMQMGRIVEQGPCEEVPASRRWHAASRGWSIRQPAASRSTASISRRCGKQNSVRCAGVFSSSSRTRIDRSIRAARSARRSLRGR